MNTLHDRGSTPQRNPDLTALHSRSPKFEVINAQRVYLDDTPSGGNSRGHLGGAVSCLELVKSRRRSEINHLWRELLEAPRGTLSDHIWAGPALDPERAKKLNSLRDIHNRTRFTSGLVCSVETVLSAIVFACIADEFAWRRWAWPTREWPRWRDSLFEVMGLSQLPTRCSGRALDWPNRVRGTFATVRLRLVMIVVQDETPRLGGGVAAPAVFGGREIKTKMLI